MSIVFDDNTFRSGARVLARVLNVDPTIVTYQNDEYEVDGVSFAYFDDLDWNNLESSLREWLPYYHKDLDHIKDGTCHHTPICRAYEQNDDLGERG